MLINLTFACLAIPAFTQRFKVSAQRYKAMENREHSAFSGDNSLNKKKGYISLISGFCFDDMSQNPLDYSQQEQVPTCLSKVPLIFSLISKIKRILKLDRAYKKTPKPQT